MTLVKENYLEHYGILRKSGRYPWGSGGPEITNHRSFLDAVQMLKQKGLKDTEIAEGFGITTTQLRQQKTIARTQHKQEQIQQAQRLSDKGYSNVAIGQRMGINESSVRSLLAPGTKARLDVLQATTDMLKKQVEAKQYLDVGSNVEMSLPLGDNPSARIGISPDKFKTALAQLQQEGYKIHYIKIPQLGTGHETTLKVLTKDTVPYSEAYRNRFSIKQIDDHSTDGGHTFGNEIHPPVSIASKRVAVRYAEDGGSKEDGLIYIRPNVKDTSIGASRYAQVRIAVDGTHYIKGMAVYKDDLPNGVDVLFNTNKSNTGNKKDAMKEFEKKADGTVNHENPFNAQISRQSGVMNIVNEEGKWDTWSKSLSSQFLSKQSPALARQQLDVTFERRQKEFDEITKLTNPAVRKKLLDTFADETDSASVHLKAAHMPRQATKVLLPVNSVKPTEIYAPTFKNGERVALVRFPHGGPFEIPFLTVNNRNPEARKLFGSDAPDAVGIHHDVAARLSGADFDGDHVLVIPNERGLVKNKPPLAGLKNFEPSRSYPPYDGMTTINGGTYNASTGRVEFKKGTTPIGSRKQQEMGKITNLIADMSIRGANEDELARAVRHSMVVIDSEKHALDYKASARDNGISHLKAKYQGSPKAGASTLITRATSEKRVNQRKPRPASEGGPIDPVTGKKVFVDTGASYVNRRGQTVLKKEISTKLAETDDAHTLSSGMPIETLYANHSNKLKALANSARKESVHTKTIPYSPSAKTTYSNEVASLNAKLNLALKNAPLERHAQVIANALVSQRRQENPDMEPESLRKIKAQSLAVARDRTGARKQRIFLTQAEWDAIQAGAISNHMLTKILNNADLETVKKLATPKAEPKMTATNKARAKSMLSSGYTQAEVAEALGVGLSTLKLSISE